MKLVSKISAATVIGKIPTETVQIDGKPAVRGIEQPLLRVVGIADKIKTGNSNFGEWVRFMGQFDATNILTGEVFRGPGLHLPAMITELLRPVVEKNVADKGNGVTFAFDIGVKPAANAFGYEYTVTDLVPTQDADPLSLLKSQLLANAPALPQPKATAPALTDATTAPAADAAPATETAAADQGDKASKGKSKAAA